MKVRDESAGQNPNKISGFAFLWGCAIILGFPQISSQESGKIMANTKQAAKRARQAVKQRGHNMGQRSELRTAIKKVRVAVAAGDMAQAEAVFKTSVSTIDSIADKNIIHKNKAARHKSRLSAAIKAIGSKAQAAAQA
jgi:small subunit ribosomal protein S20